MMGARGLWVAVAMAIGCGGGPIRIKHAPNLAMGQRLIRYNLEAQLFNVANGMQLMILPEANTNLVKVDVRYKVGASEDPDGKSGLAHMVEHMTYQLRPHGQEGPTLSNRFSELALYHNAYTTWDETQYTSVAMREQLAGLLALESARMTAPCEQLDDGTVAHEREVIRNEVQWRTGVATGGIKFLRDEIYGAGHAYQRSVGGSDVELTALGRADVCEFLRNYYVPSNAILVVSGNVSVGYVTNIAEQLFGELEAKEGKPRAVVKRPVLRGTRSRHELAIEQATALIAFAATPTMTDGALYEQLVIEILERRLYTLLAKRKYITSVAAGITGGERAPLAVAVVSVSDPDKLDSAVAEVFERMGDFLDSFDEDDLVTLRENQRASLLRSVEPFMREASIFTDYLQYSGHKLFVIKDLDALAAVQLSALKVRAKRLLDKSASHVVMIYPNEKAIPTEKRAEVSFSSKDYDIHDWQTPVDPETADRPLPIPKQQGRTAVRSFKLYNGLEVVLAPALEHPVVDIRMVYRAGSLHDPDNKPGLARTAMYLLQPNIPLLQNSKELFDLQMMLKMGGDFDQYMDERTTTFRATGLAMYMDALLWRLHWLLENGIYDKEALSKWNDILSRGGEPSDKSRAKSLLLRALLATLYGADHPYVRRSGKTKISVEDLRRFRARHYRMNGATLIMTGSFDGDFAEAEIRRLFSWGGGPAAPPVPQVPPSAERTAPHYLAGYDEDQLQTEITIAFDTRPGFGVRHAARMVLLEMLESRMSSLRESLGASYGASVDHLDLEGPGVLLISASVDRDRVGEAFQAMLTALSEVRTGDLRADFVRARKRVLQRSLANTTDSGSVAGELEYVVTYELPPDYFEKLVEQVATLKLDDVRALITSELAANQQVVMARGRRASVEAMYQAASIGKYRVIGTAKTNKPKANKPKAK